MNYRSEAAMSFILGCLRTVWRKAVDASLVTGYTFLERVVPASSSACFTSYPDVDDNSAAVFIAAVRSGEQNRSRLIWLVSDRKLASERLQARLGADALEVCDIVKKNSLLGLWRFLRARRVYFTHGHYRFVTARPGGDKLINLWHGMPVKAIGCLDGKTAAEIQASHKVIASSRFFHSIMARAFALREQDVIVAALPRCDLLFEPFEYALAFRDAALASGGRKLIAWMPTYTISSVGEIRADSSQSRSECLNVFLKRLEDLSSIAIKRGYTFLIKLHPMDFLNDERLPDVARIKVITRASPEGRLLTCCDFLAVSDALVTDVSSVCFDFIGTGKPMLIDSSPIRGYKRRLLFDPAILSEIAFCTDDISSAQSFFDAIDSGHVMDKERGKLFCESSQAGAASRLLQLAPITTESSDTSPEVALSNDN